MDGHANCLLGTLRLCALVSFANPFFLLVSYANRVLSEPSFALAHAPSTTSGVDEVAVSSFSHVSVSPPKLRIA